MILVMKIFAVVALLLLFGANEERVLAASAVAAGVGSDGKVKWGWAGGGMVNEADVRTRALGFCMASGGLNAKLIASTSKRGYGAIVVYQLSRNRFNITASVGATSEQQAVSDALRKAKAAGGRTAKVWRAWHDVPSTTINL